MNNETNKNQKTFTVDLSSPELWHLEYFECPHKLLRHIEDLLEREEESNGMPSAINLVMGISHRNMLVRNRLAMRDFATGNFYFTGSDIYSSAKIVRPD